MSAGRPPARYAATLDRLRTLILAGHYETTGMLPGERELAGELAVSRTTLRRVLAALVQESVLVNRQGVGTFVAPRVSATPAVPSGFSAAALRRGLVPSSRGIEHAVVEPTPEQAMLLGAGPRSRVVRLRRLRCIEGELARLEENVIPLDLAPDLAAMEGSLYAAMAARGLVPRRALQRLRARGATPAEATALGVAPGSAVVLLSRTDYLADGRCCLLTAATLRADGFDLLIEAPGEGPAL